MKRLPNKLLNVPFIWSAIIIPILPFPQNPTLNLPPSLPHMNYEGSKQFGTQQVKGLKEGDEVYGDVNATGANGPKQFGTLAEYTAVEEKLLALKPKNLDFVQAAVLPLAIETAYEGLERAGFCEGKSILVLNGAGGVGSFHRRYPPATSAVPFLVG